MELIGTALMACCQQGESVFPKENVLEDPQSRVVDSGEVILRTEGRSSELDRP